jgi:hypothetical protein
MLLFFVHLWGWSETKSAITEVTYWPIIPALEVGDDCGTIGELSVCQGKLRYSEKTCPSATLSTINPSWFDPGSNPGRRGGEPATNRLSYGTAKKFDKEKKIYPTINMSVFRRGKCKENFSVSDDRVGMPNANY